MTSHSECLLQPVDPRPDLRRDSEWWTSLLMLAYIPGPADPQGVFGVLHGLRCLGASLARSNRQLRISHGEIPEAEYADLRRDWLVPQGTTISQLLSVLDLMLPADTAVDVADPGVAQVRAFELPEMH
jgi:hypothetical protein